MKGRHRQMNLLHHIKRREYIKQNQGKSGQPKQHSSGLRRTRKHSPSATMDVGSESDTKSSQAQLLLIKKMQSRIYKKQQLGSNCIPGNFSVSVFSSLFSVLLSLPSLFLLIFLLIIAFSFLSFHVSHTPPLSSF